MKNKVLFKKKWFWPVVVAVIIAVIAIFLFTRSNGKNDNGNYFTVTRSDFSEKVSFSGKVIAHDRADLGFDLNGRIAKVNVRAGDMVKKGDVLAEIENGDLRAEVVLKSANLQKENAKLASTLAGTRTEQLNIDEQKYHDASNALITAMRSAYFQTESAILNKVDSVFSNGNSVNPVLNIRTDSDNQKRSTENQRLTITENLDKWKKTISTLSYEASIVDINNARKITSETIYNTKTFLDNITNIVNNLSTGNSGMTQSEIDTYRSNVNTAAQSAATAATTWQTADAAWSLASNSLTLSQSGNTEYDIEAQYAGVRVAEADLINAKARLNKTMIIAPFDGIVAKVDAKIGETVTTGTSKIFVMSAGLFDIESYVPEVDVALLQASSTAVVTLDAYGPDISFLAEVVSVDSAETIKDGVSTYKTVLRFKDNDDKIKSGMTANVNITAYDKNNVIVVPRSAIMIDGNSRSVMLKNGDSWQKSMVEVGSTSLGRAEIVSGLNEGDVIMINPK